ALTPPLTGALRPPRVACPERVLARGGGRHMADDEGGRVTDLKRSSRDRDELRCRLEAWLARRLPPGARPRIDGLAGTSANGMSSETLVVDARWREGGAERRERLVARLAPGPEDVPVFPSYDLDRQ